ncbi:MAG: efflux RND transporter periplasmic adaptor subunit [Verrucomicrobiales bacterium]|nr:efflux RND transporter periplasmic adaptor subunit [Verrucomicrobiales bacterium]
MVSCEGEKNESKAASAVPLVNVQTTKAARRLYSDRVEALGTVRALEAIDLTSSVTDRVAEMFFEDGDSAKEGDLLVRLEDAAERAAFEAAKSTLTEQEREIERLRGLVANGAVSQVRLQEYETQQEIAARRVEEAQAQIDDRNIRAPFDGVLGFRRVSQGALVEPGDLIATFDVLDPIKLDFTVPETFLSSLKKGLQIEAHTEAYPGDDFSGKVVQLDTRVNPVTRSITARAEIPNPDKRLRPGMLMTTVLENNPRNSVSVPERALVSVQSTHFVFVLDEKTSPPSVVRASVELGRRQPGYVEILNGVEEGAVVVTDGLIGLVDGAEVKVTGEFKGPAEPYQPSDQ